MKSLTSDVQHRYFLFPLFFIYCRECVNKSASFSESGCNILHHACRYGLLDLVQANLNAQVDVTVR